MFTKFQMELEGPISENQVAVISMALNHINGIKKAYVDPVFRKNVTVMAYPAVNLTTIKQDALRMINEFIKENDTKMKENNKNHPFFYKAHLDGLVCGCKGANKENVAQDMLEKNWIKLLDGPDISFGREVKLLLNFFDRTYCKYILSHINNVEELWFSPLIATEHIKNMDLLGSKPCHLFSASHVDTEPPKFYLQSAPCFKIYISFEKQKLNHNSLYTVIGGCFRNETKSTYLMERLYHFTMREFVAIGDPGFVLEYRDKLLKYTVDWMEKIGIGGFCEEAPDSFFMTSSKLNKFDIPPKIKQEVRALLPYRNDSIAIASYDTHGDFFSKTFSFGVEGAKATWSGCIGLGLERAVWSFLQQNGLDKRKWPKFVRDGIEVIENAG